MIQYCFRHFKFVQNFLFGPCDDSRSRMLISCSMLRKSSSPLGAALASVSRMASALSLSQNLSLIRINQKRRKMGTRKSVLGSMCPTMYS